ncbi:MAG: glycosyl hydrolase family 8 [Treponemataceae bacterium]|nr:glycosyl hydrolase family 8 [Treponemataceae bacterium]
MKNTFLDYGYTEIEVENRVNDTFEAIFEGMDRFYFEGLRDTGYFMDTGNCDARTEGISYAMMMCVMMDRQDYFDRLWKFAMEFMYMEEGPFKGYFAWSVAPDGKKNSFGPAPDGEEFFAMSLIFASKKWGNKDGIYEYSAWAQKILHTMVHHQLPMFNRENHLVLFVPACRFSDPSYHLMHFYRAFADFLHGKRDVDAFFWEKAEKASRDYLVKACDPKTGMSPEYGTFEGKPEKFGPPEGHGDFYSDAYRTGANIGLDALWCGKNAALSEIADNLVSYFADIDPADYRKYHVDGKPTEEKALHPVALLSTLAQTTLACTEKASDAAEKIVRRFWETPLRKGERRYYDNCLYMFAMLALSGKYEFLPHGERPDFDDFPVPL